MWSKQTNFVELEDPRLYDGVFSVGPDDNGECIWNVSEPLRGWWVGVACWSRSMLENESISSWWFRPFFELGTSKSDGPNALANDVISLKRIEFNHLTNHFIEGHSLVSIVGVSNLFHR